MSCPYIPRVKSSGGLKDSASEASTPLSSPLHLSDEPPTLSVEEALSLAKSSCPAFQSSCPFKNVKDAEEMKRAMSTIPRSHLERNIDPTGKQEDHISTALRVALQHVHHVSHSLHQDPGVEKIDSISVSHSSTKKYEITGGCPFKTLYTQPHGESSKVFVDVMEKFSLSAIMASMIHSSFPEVDEVVHLLHESDKDKDDHDTAPAPVTSVESSPIYSSSSHRKSLSISLKTGTAASHVAAESVHFVKEFIHGNIDRNMYAFLVLDLFHIYSTLESELEKHAPTLFPQVYFPKELNRKESLQDDVEFFHGIDIWKKISPTKAAQEYQERIRYIASKEPLLLLSHAYTRYLGDLSGGRILARVARRAMNLPRDTSDGLRFYEFDHVKSPKIFKDEYRKSLDDMEFSSNEVDRLVAEANVAFVLNMRVFEEFDVLAGVNGAKVRPIEEALVYYEDCVRRQNAISPELGDSTRFSMEEKEEQESKCPFAFLGGPNPHALVKGNEASIADRSITGGDNRGTNQEMSVHDHGRCPWPFILLHDPITGFRDYQTWVVLGLLICWLYKSWYIDGSFQEDL